MGKTRHEKDFYPTPAEVTQTLRHFISPEALRDASIIEPCAGDLSMAREIKNMFPSCTVCTNDPYSGHEGLTWTDDATLPESWRKWTENTESIPIVITNPPFNQAAKIIGHAIDYARFVVALLPLNFLEPVKGRREFWREYGHNFEQIAPLNPRVRFREDTNGTASMTVAWLVFSWRTTSKVYIPITDWKEGQSNG